MAGDTKAWPWGTTEWRWTVQPTTTTDPPHQPQLNIPNVIGPSDWGEPMMLPHQPSLVVDPRYFVALLEMLMPSTCRELLRTLRASPDSVPSRAALADSLRDHNLDTFAELIAGGWTP